MRSCYPLCVFVLSCLMLAVCTPAERVLETPSQEVSIEAEIQAIDSLREKYMDAYRSEDVTALVDLFTADALRMPPNEPTLRGSEELRDYFGDTFEHKSLNVAVTTDELEFAGDWAYACGTYSAEVKDNASEEVTEDNGKWVNILKREPDRTWKTHRNIWNSDNPLPEIIEE